MLDLQRLRMLRELKRNGTLAAVATAMSFSPATISQQMARLEAEAGVKLLEPVGRGVRLTTEADLLVERTEELLEVLERAEADLVAAQGELKGTVRLAIFQSAALAFLPSVLAHLHSHYPAIRLEVSHLEPEYALAALLSRDVDIAVAQEYPGEPLPRNPQIQLQTLLLDSIRLALPIGHSGQALEHLEDSHWVMEPPGTPAQRWTVARCREAGFEPNIQFSSLDLVLHRRLIETGNAVGFLPGLTGAWESQDMRTLPLGISAAHRIILTATRHGSDSHPRILAVRQALEEASR